MSCFLNFLEWLLFCGETDDYQRLRANEREEKEREQRRLENARERAREIERGREKNRQAVEMATKEARLKAERAAVEKARAEARERAGRAAVQKAQAKAAERAARERAERATTEARERAAAEAREKETRERATLTKVQLIERANVERDFAEAQERLAAKAGEKAATAARERAERAATEARERAAAEAREKATRERASLTKVQLIIERANVERAFAEAREKRAAKVREMEPGGNQQKNKNELKKAPRPREKELKASKVPPNSTKDVLVQNDIIPISVIPKEIKHLFKKDIAPEVLKKPLSLTTYKDYFAALLYSEDFYIEGFLYRVVHRNIVVADFEDDFHSQHVPSRRYDVSFSFNRICLKRCHQAISAATDPLFQGFLFPKQNFGTTYLHPNSFHLSLNSAKELALKRILSLRGSPPYLIKGPLSTTDYNGKLSKTGFFIQEAVLQIYRTSPDCRILITSPTNKKCDILIRSLEEIPDSEILRVNAAFREYFEVPDDILPACRYEEGCFTCPPLHEFCNFKITSSTFMSCFRLYGGGICAGHYSHIFLVDASSATEPEAMVALANLVGQSTAVIVTGASRDSSRWVRSDISRKYGLKVSYFERLMQNEPYLSSDPRFVYDLEVKLKSEDYYYRDFDFD